MNMDYLRDRPMYDGYLPLVNDYLQNTFQSPPIEIANDQLDNKEATDFLINIDGKQMRFGCRIRANKFNTYCDFTVRNERESGNECEAAKLSRGLCNYLFYAVLNMERTGFSKVIIVNTKQLFADKDKWEELDIVPKVINNAGVDKTTFLAFKDWGNMVRYIKHYYKE